MESNRKVSSLPLSTGLGGEARGHRHNPTVRVLPGTVPDTQTGSSHSRGVLALGSGSRGQVATSSGVLLDDSFSCHWWGPLSYVSYISYSSENTQEKGFLLAHGLRSSAWAL